MRIFNLAFFVLLMISGGVFVTASYAGVQVSSRWSCKSSNTLKESIDFRVFIDGDKNFLTAYLNNVYSGNASATSSDSTVQPWRQLDFGFSASEPRYGVVLGYDIKFLGNDYQWNSAKAVIISKELYSCVDDQGAEINIDSSDYLQKFSKIKLDLCSELRTKVDLVDCNKVSN